MHLGAEVFDVSTQPIHDHSHLFLRQGAGLEGQAIFRHKMTFRPHSTDTLTHRKVTMNMAERSQKTKGTKVHAIGDTEKDPEKSKAVSVNPFPHIRAQEMVRREEERLRAAMRRDNSSRRIRERGAYGALSSSYLEPGDSDEEIDNVGAIKRQFKQSSGAVLRGERDEDDYTPLGSSRHAAGGSESSRRLERAKRIVSDDDNASDEEAAATTTTQKRRVIEDDEE